MNAQPNKTAASRTAPSKTEQSNTASQTSSGRRTVPALHGVKAWRELLSEEELRCDRTGFQAGIISIDHGATGRPEDAMLTNTTEDQRTATVLSAIAEHLQFTHRVCALNEDELCILLIPVAAVGAAEELAHKVDAALRASGINAAIGFALRREDGHGLLGAAARADACAAVAHSRQLRLTA